MSILSIDVDVNVVTMEATGYQIVHINFSQEHIHTQTKLLVFLISSFRLVQNVVCFLLGDSPASDLYMPTFRNTLSVPSSKAGVK